MARNPVVPSKTEETTATQQCGVGIAPLVVDQVSFITTWSTLCHHCRTEKKDSLASVSARVDTFDTILSFLFFSSTFAIGICLDLLVGEDGRALCAGFFPRRGNGAAGLG